MFQGEKGTHEFQDCLTLRGSLGFRMFSAPSEMGPGQTGMSWSPLERRAERRPPTLIFYYLKNQTSQASIINYCHLISLGGKCVSVLVLFSAILYV